MRKVLILGLFLALVTAGCDSVPDDTVDAVADTSVDFCGYHTFSFYSVDEAEGSTEPLPPSAATAETLFKNEVRTQFAAVGVTESGTDPDLRVNFLWAINESTQIITDCGSYWYGGYYGYACIEYEEEVPVGTVMIDFVDPTLDTSGRVVFRGVIQGILTGEDTEERIANDVAKVFEKYPPNVTPCL